MNTIIRKRLARALFFRGTLNINLITRRANGSRDEMEIIILYIKESLSSADTLHDADSRAQMDILLQPHIVHLSAREEIKKFSYGHDDSQRCANGWTALGPPFFILLYQLSLLLKNALKQKNFGSLSRRVKL